MYKCWIQKLTDPQEQKKKLEWKKNKHIEHIIQKRRERARAKKNTVHTHLYVCTEKTARKRKQTLAASNNIIHVNILACQEMLCALFPVSVFLSSLIFLSFFFIFISFCSCNAFGEFCFFSLLCSISFTHSKHK